MQSGDLEELSSQTLALSRELGSRKARVSRKRWENEFERRLNGSHFPEMLSYYEIDDRKSTNPRGTIDRRGDCKVCGRKIRYRCQQCDVFLHIKSDDDDATDCWRIFHTEEKFLHLKAAAVSASIANSKTILKVEDSSKSDI